MHVILLFLVASLAWGITAKSRSKTTGSAVGLAVLGGVLAVIVSFCLYSWLPSDFQRGMLRKMPDGQYIIMFEVLPALIGSVIVGVLAIPKARSKAGQPGSTH